MKPKAAAQGEVTVVYSAPRAVWHAVSRRYEQFKLLREAFEHFRIRQHKAKQIPKSRDDD